MNDQSQFFFNPTDPPSTPAGQAISGVKTVLFHIDIPEVPFPVEFSTETVSQFTFIGNNKLSLPVGVYRIAFGSIDNADNFSELGVATVIVDGTPPTTTLTFPEPSTTFVNPVGNLYIPESQAISFAPADPGELAAGVDKTFFTAAAVQSLIDEGLNDNTAELFGVFEAPFILNEGVSTIVFGSRDKVGHYETQLNIKRVFIDGTIPSAAIIVNGEHTIDAALTIEYEAGVTFTLVANDPVSNGLASGPGKIRMYIDEDRNDPSCRDAQISTEAVPGSCANPFFTGSVNLSSGNHVLDFAALDNVGNEGEFVSKNIVVTPDVTAPVITGLLPIGAEEFIVSSGDITISFTVTDAFDPAPDITALLVQVEDRGVPIGQRPAAIDVSSGLVLNPLDIDDGIWKLTVTALDIAGNLATEESGTFEVIHDLLPPRSALAVGDPLFLVGGKKLIFSERADQPLFAEFLCEIHALTGRGARLYLPKEAA